MSKGITGCAGGDPLFDVVDPGSSNGSLDGLKTAGTMNLKKGIILKRRLLFPPPPAAFAGFRPASGEPALVTVQTEGAIHLVITRPGGQRVGFDSATGTHYAEISGSSYSPEFPISEPENGYDNAEAAALLDSIPRVIQFASIVDEIITIGVRASQTGPFSLRFDGTTGSDELGKFVLSGWLAAGGVTNLTAQIKTLAPPLTIVAQSSGNVTLGWPLTCPTCILESAGALSAAWTAVTNAPVVNAPNYNMTLPSTGLRRFFRLAK